MSVLIRYGNQSEGVTAIQFLLNIHLVLEIEPLAVDGIFGPLTLTATKRFQSIRGLTADGIAGPLTINALLGEPDFPAGEAFANSFGANSLIGVQADRSPLYDFVEDDDDASTTGIVNPPFDHGNIFYEPRTPAPSVSATEFGSISTSNLLAGPRIAAASKYKRQKDWYLKDCDAYMASKGLASFISVKGFSAIAGPIILETELQWKNRKGKQRARKYTSSSLGHGIQWSPANALPIGKILGRLFKNAPSSKGILKYLKSKNLQRIIKIIEKGSNNVWIKIILQAIQIIGQNTKYGIGNLIPGKIYPTVHAGKRLTRSELSRTSLIIQISNTTMITSELNIILFGATLARHLTHPILNASRVVALAVLDEHFYAPLPNTSYSMVEFNANFQRKSGK